MRYSEFIWEESLVGNEYTRKELNKKLHLQTEFDGTIQFHKLSNGVKYIVLLVLAQKSYY